MAHEAEKILIAQDVLALLREGKVHPTMRFYLVMRLVPEAAEKLDHVISIKTALGNLATSSEGYLPPCRACACGALLVAQVERYGDSGRVALVGDSERSANNDASIFCALEDFFGHDEIAYIEAFFMLDIEHARRVRTPENEDVFLHLEELIRILRTKNGNEPGTRMRFLMHEIIRQGGAFDPLKITTEALSHDA